METETEKAEVKVNLVGEGEIEILSLVPMVGLEEVKVGEEEVENGEKNK